jgi:hypothetical protein
MVPIHDSDIAAERWNQTEWQHYELWEKIEIRLKRRRNLWIAGTVLVFLALSSIPILVDRWPKWTSLKAARKLGEEINGLKRLAGIENQAFRIVFSQDRKLSYSILKVPSCTAEETANAAMVVQSGSLLNGSRLDQYVLLSRDEGNELGIPGLLQSLCYDPLAGSTATNRDEAISGFGIIPVKDLTEKRQDRISLLIFKGPSAEVSFE